MFEQPHSISGELKDRDKSKSDYQCKDYKGKESLARQTATGTYLTKEEDSRRTQPSISEPSIVVAS